MTVDEILHELLLMDCRNDHGYAGGCNTSVCCGHNPCDMCLLVKRIQERMA